jgi:hypothetical protein
MSTDDYQSLAIILICVATLFHMQWGGHRK